MCRGTWPSLPDGGVLASACATAGRSLVTGAGPITVGKVSNVVAANGEADCWASRCRPRSRRTRRARVPLGGGRQPDRCGSRTPGALSGGDVIVSGIPRSANHNGGRIAFGPDGMLYAGAGDATAGTHAPEPTEPGRQDPADDDGGQAGARQPGEDVAGLVLRPPQRAGPRLGRQEPAVGHRVRPEHLGRAQPDPARPQLRLARRRGRRRLHVRGAAADLARRGAVPVRDRVPTPASCTWRRCAGGDCGGSSSGPMAR